MPKRLLLTDGEVALIEKHRAKTLAERSWNEALEAAAIQIEANKLVTEATSIHEVVNDVTKTCAALVRGLKKDIS